jgi:UDPglucose 6-dehydrogenase
MKNKYSVGILGGGFVGSAVAFGFGSSNGHQFDVRVHDIDPTRSTHSFTDMSTKSDFIFVCLPTPQSEDGAIDLKYIEEGILSLSKVIDPFNQTIIIKSTVIPGTCRRLSKKYGINIVSNPEFLTERRAKWDFINAAQVVIGSDEKDSAAKVRSLYEKRFSAQKYVITDSTTSEFIKYMLNCFFSTKNSFMNEMFEIGRGFGADWPSAVEGLVGDSRVADSHVTVPGPDGVLGFGGHCFPKDLNAMIKFAERLGVNPTVMSAAWEKNKEVRKDIP